MNFSNGRKYRILDANFNRAREALRVIEDMARFINGDARVYGKIKRIRHKLSGLTRDIYPRLLKHRDSETDVSARQKERGRKSIREILKANFIRAEEAIRVLEEFSKLISPEAGYRLKRLRFRVYGIEKEMKKI
jgi:thiamine-phosphate pyrophosphorylase